MDPTEMGDPVSKPPTDGAHPCPVQATDWIDWLRALHRPPKAAMPDLVELGSLSYP